MMAAFAFPHAIRITGEAEDLSLNPKKQFSIHEDRHLLALIGKHGLKSWAALAREMPNRTAKQCRERWHNHLNPQINRGPWSAAEDRILALQHRELGNRWADIAKYLPGRTDTLVKNRWNTSVRARLDDIERSSSVLGIERHSGIRTLVHWSSPSMMDFNSIPPLIEHHR
jgi:hypothetical protein